jgi:hypothetical protein
MKMADLCAELRNYFDYERSFGIFEIKNGSLVVNDLRNGQYFRIIGSVFNDGVYQYPETHLTDEIFNGAVWYMAVPPDVTTLVSEMNAWEQQYSTVLSSPFNSESVDGYSYTKASSGSSAGSDGTPNALAHFADRLKHWRKARAV